MVMVMVMVTHAFGGQAGESSANKSVCHPLTQTA